ncbi:helicase HerA domain-containing protein [Nonomuraea sp. ATR24]
MDRAVTAGAAALAALRFNYAEGADDVWRHSDHHVDGLHGPSAGIVLTGLTEAAEGRDTSPIGVVVQGQRGTGKTHLLGWVREQAQRRGGYFVLVGLLDAKGFWESTVVSVLDSLSRDAAEGQSQLGLFLTRLASAADLSRMERRAVSGRKAVTREVLDRFVTALRRLDRQVGSQAQDTARALVLYASDDLALQDLGEAFLSSAPEGEPGERARWGIRQVDRTPQEIVRDVSRLLALTGPAIVAVDQIDALVAQSPIATDPLAREPGESAMIERIAGGLMDLREVTRRTLTVVTCLPATWTLIEKVAVDTVRDRFRQAVQLKTLPDAQTAARLVARRFEVQYAAAGFEPPYPTWPVRPEAFEQAPGFTPRQLLITIDDHVQGCVQDGQVRELTRLTGSGTGTTRQSPVPDAGLLAAIDTRFARLRDAAEPPELDAATEDVIVPALLAAGLAAWVGERGEAGKAFSVDPPPSAKPPLHARLRHTLDEETEDEAHWAFRAVSAAHGNAALNRVRKASVAAGLDPRVPKRRLFLLRNAPWSPGVRTKEAIAAFEHAGGRTLPVTRGDLKVLAALKALLAENPPGLASWLTTRRPTSAIAFLTQALTGPWTVPPEPPQSDASTPGVAPSGPGGGTPEAPAPAPGAAASGSGGGALGAPAAGGAGPQTAAPAPVVSGVPVSGDFGGGEYVDVGVRVQLEGLRKHVAIFAGTGSGKTVLIRRLVEECALRGVSAIVLDPNNDLARLGDRWPERPEGWAEGDERKAEAYLAGTDVVVWTPRRAAGRPLSFQPLPDLAGVAADPDEFGEAVEAAMAAVAPRLKLTAQTVKAQRGQAVLRKALEWYGRRGGTTLRGLAGMLAALPEGVSELADAERIAADLAQSLRAAMDNDPLFGGEGTPVDPGLLLTPPPGRRARVSVVSLAGLPGDEQRQSFVSQLQLALFAWVKKNPAGDRPLGGLFVMDEAQTFAPAAGGVTACLRSTLALASQARKYGLGLVFATQAPKGLHNQIPGNAATQFFGLLNAPIQIGAAREMARAKGGDVPDVSRLRSGEFYVALEGRGPVRTRVPMCLSHHPRAPLTTEEVIARAARPSPPAPTSRPARSSC